MTDEFDKQEVSENYCIKEIFISSDVLSILQSQPLSPGIVVEQVVEARHLFSTETFNVLRYIILSLF